MEDFVPFEIAKKLKEKGFDYQGFDYIDFEGEVIRQDRPTHQMAMKWLREEKNVLIYVYPVIDLPVKNDYTFHWRWDGKKKIHSAPHIGDKHNYESYEKAVEAALKYVLENLI